MQMTSPEDKPVKIQGNAFMVKSRLKDLGAVWDSLEKAWLIPRELHAEAQRIVDESEQAAKHKAQEQKILEKEDPGSVIEEARNMAEVWLGYIENSLQEEQWYPKGETRLEKHRKTLKRLKEDTAWIDTELKRLVEMYRSLPNSWSKRKALPSKTLMKRLGFIK
jgi:hypothetical protein